MTKLTHIRKLIHFTQNHLNTACRGTKEMAYNFLIITTVQFETVLSFPPKSKASKWSLIQ